jgi:hypothetical protein
MLTAFIIISVIAVVIADVLDERSVDGPPRASAA